VGFSPAQAEADAQAAHFRRRIDSARVFGDVEAGDADLASHANHAHQRVEHGGRGFVLDAVVAVAAGFEAYRINGAVDFRLAQQSGDLFVQRRVLGQVGNFETLGLGVSQADRVDVADDHDCRVQQASGSSSGQATRAGTGDVDSAARTNASSDGAMVAGGQDVGQAVFRSLHR